MTNGDNSNTKNILSLIKKSPLIIAGPCSAESREQLLGTAEELSRNHKVNIFRAGLWKPRTRPGTFEGHGAEALPWLLEVKSRFGLPIATEVATPEHVKIVAQSDVDVLWIGARTAADPFAMQALADAIGKNCPDTPIFIKNPINPDLDLWMGAIQRLERSGVKNIGAIHRGFSVYKSAPYRNAPIWQIPMELHRRMPSLRILHDPSHTGGAREHLLKLSQQALDMGFNGLIIETHPYPELALSDGGQQITPASLNELLSSLIIRETKTHSDALLTQLRTRIDSLDSQLLAILAQRMQTAEEIGIYKKEHDMPVVQSERYERLLTSILEQGCALGLNENFLTRMLEIIHAESVRNQLSIINSEDK